MFLTAIFLYLAYIENLINCVLVEPESDYGSDFCIVFLIFLVFAFPFFGAIIMPEKAFAFLYFVLSGLVSDPFTYMDFSCLQNSLYFNLEHYLCQEFEVSNQSSVFFEQLLRFNRNCCRA
jgi:hypothetical protein